MIPTRIALSAIYLSIKNDIMRGKHDKRDDGASRNSGRRVP
jgi:hypothetical protein